MSDHSAYMRQQLIDAIRGHQAHLDFDAAVRDFPPVHRGRKPDQAPHSAWELLEHMRIAQHDILEFSRNAQHESPPWPEGYWPKESTPKQASDWDRSVQAFKHDAGQLNQMLNDPKSDLYARLPHGEGQTLLREALLVSSHN
jgi:hypothetical protein